MFKFNDISDKDEGFNIENHLLTPRKFFEKRRLAKKVYVFDLRNPDDFAISHLPGAHNLPFEYFEDSIYQMPFSGEIMLYGNGEKELYSTAELLYDNGFDTFYFVPSYDSLIASVDSSFFKISQKAQEHISNILNAFPEKFKGISLIVEIKSDRKANYSIQFFEKTATPVENISIDLEKFQILVAKEAIPYLEGTEVDLNDKNELESFNPSMSITKISGSVEEQIQHVLDEEVNPMVASHGGVVSLLEVKDHNAFLEFGGGCQGCGMIDVTLKQGVEVMIKAQIPEIEAIYDVTDHAGGTNPYYQPSEK